MNLSGAAFHPITSTASFSVSLSSLMGAFTKEVDIDWDVAQSLAFEFESPLYPALFLTRQSAIAKLEHADLESTDTG